MPNRTIIIGDVHGCVDELDELLGLLSPEPTDRLVFIGDLIDRGPDSAGAVKRFFELAHSHGAQLVLGNHEEKFLRYLHHLETNSGLEKQMKSTEEFPGLLEKLSEAELQGLRQAYYALHLEDLGVLLVHGGTLPRVKFPFPATYRYGEHSPKHFPGLELMNKVRFWDPLGNFVGLGTEKPLDRYWAETYGGAFGHVVFGHQPFLQDRPKVFAHATGIDTGCVFGGWLSALVWENGSSRSVHVKAKRTYAELRH
jgi:serine/threonine protein phosphatase 1